MAPRRPYEGRIATRNGHLNTLLGHFNKGGLPPYVRQRVETADGDFFDVDRIPGPPGAPKLVAFHGLEGSSTSAYMRRLMRAAVAAGWESAVVHARGCSGSDNRHPHSYHAGFVDDVDVFLRAERARSPHLPLVCVGYSLGGSQLGNWLGRTHDAHDLVDAAVLVSPPLRLWPGAEALDRGVNRHIYGRRFLRSLTSKVRAKAERWPALRTQALAAANARSIREYDHLWTGPMHGFDGAEDYYRKAESAPWIRHIEVPTRVLHAADDPFVTVDAVPAVAFVGARAAELVRTRHGGHVGFQRGPRGGRPGWLERWIMASLCELAPTLRRG